MTTEIPAYSPVALDSALEALFFLEPTLTAYSSKIAEDENFLTLFLGIYEANIRDIG